MNQTVSGGDDEEAGLAVAAAQVQEVAIVVIRSHGDTEDTLLVVPLVAPGVHH